MRVKPLHRLLIVDLRHMWGQALAICAVLACGVGTFVMATSTIRSLDATRESYYRDYYFAHAFVDLVRAPNELALRLADIPGVARVQTRVVKDVILDVPDMAEPASCRLVSISDESQPKLNRIYLRGGRLTNPQQRGEVIASDTFASAHGWQPGDQFQVIMGGRKQPLTIVGIALSPEYIYAVQPGQLLSDDRRFGVLWMPYQQMAAAFNMEGAFNNATFTLHPGASLPQVLFYVDQLTESYGGRGAYSRDDQMSHRRVADEMHQLRGMAFVTPSIFLAVSAFLFNIVLSRMVHHQQEQIAVLRAFGYTRWEIGGYYLSFLLLLTLFGAVAGCILGVSLSRWVTDLYAYFFKFPLVSYQFAKDQAALALMISGLAALAGGFSAVRRAIRLQPAVAMRPEAPPSSHASLLERLGLRRLLSPVMRIILRRLERNPRATILSTLGMALGVAVMVLGTFTEDAINHVINFQFQLTQRQDVLLAYNEKLAASALHDVHHLPAVTSAEPFRVVPVRIRQGNRAHRISLIALESRPQLFRVLDDRARLVDLSGPGLTVSKKLAEILNVQAGDDVRIELMEGRREHYLARIGYVFPDYMDPAAYVNRTELRRLLKENELHSGAFVSIDRKREDEFYATLKQTPNVAGVTIKRAALQNYNDTIAASLRPIRIINASFAFVIAFGVIYNCALITLAEQSRDLATLRVMGFNRWEVSTVLLGELALITVAAIPVGLPIGYLFAYLATMALDTETHRIPLVVNNATYAYSAVVILLSAAVSSLIVRRLLDKLDLISVLKVKQ